MKNVLPRMTELRRRKAEIDAAYRKKEKGIQDEVGRIVESVKNGEAETGNPITDFLFVAFESLDVPQSFDATLRMLEGQLAGKTGELFLVIQRKKELVYLDKAKSGTCTWPPTLSILEELKVIGILDGEKLILDLKGKSFGLPAKVSAEIIATDGRTSPLTQNPVMFDHLKLDDFGRKVEASHAVGLALEIVIGDSAVLGYPPRAGSSAAGFRPRGWVVALNAAARRLGKEVPVAPEEETA